MADHTQFRWTRYSSELLVVFLGVWLGLLAENYRQDRQDRAAERVSLARLARDLAFDERDMTGNSQRATAGYQAARWLLARSADNGQDIEGDSLTYYLTQLYQNTSILVPNTSEYTALKGSGRINIISDADLRQRVTELYESYPFIAALHEMDNSERRRAIEHIAAYVRPILRDSTNIWPELQVAGSPDRVLANAGFRISLGELVGLRDLIQLKYETAFKEITALRQQILASLED